jgi:hypothetical protein
MAAIASGAPARVRLGSFYAWVGVVVLLSAFLGFAPTYWAPLAAGKFQANPIVHIHGMVFFGWSVFYLVQSALPSTGNVRLHRGLGMVGISLVTLMVVVGPLAALNSLKTAVAFNVADAGEAFTIVPLVGIATFAVLMAAGFANIRSPEVHKRLMLVATTSIMGAPVARPFLAWVLTDLPPGPPPVWINWVNLICAWSTTGAPAAGRTRSTWSPCRSWSS